MKRSLKTFVALSAGTITMLAATPAYAQYDDAVGGGFALFSFICWGLWMLFLLAFTVIWIWMLIDSIARQEYEYPEGAGSKVLWIVLIILFGGLAAIIYYFMVFKKVKRGTVQPPWAQQGGVAPSAPAGQPAQPTPPPAQPTAVPPPPPPGTPAPPPAAPPQAPPVAPPAPPQEPPAAPPAPPEGSDQG